MRLLFFTLTFVVLCGFVAAQENTAASAKIADAFLLNQTTAKQAVRILGEPQKTETKSVSVIAVKDWLKDDVKKEKYKVLSFRKFQDIGQVRLTFADEKLVGIHFVVIEKKIKAVDLSAIYQVRFTPVFSEFSLKENIGEFQKTAGGVKVMSFPRDYHLVAVTRESVLAAKIFNDDPISSGYQPATGTASDIKVSPRRITGKVQELQILSRALFK